MVSGLFGAVIQSIGKTYGNRQTIEEGSQIPTAIALLRAGWALRRGLTRSAERKTFAEEALLQVLIRATLSPSRCTVGNFLSSRGPEGIPSGLKELKGLTPSRKGWAGQAECACHPAAGYAQPTVLRFKPAIEV